MSDGEAENYLQWMNSLSSRDPSSLISRIAYNFKNWQEDRGDVLCGYCREESPSRFLRDSKIDIRGVCEELGTYEGSGCAIINTLKQATDLPEVENSILALLAAGEGSRLWGVSASNGFVKALTKIFSVTLFEQTIDQCTYFLSQAPNEGKDLTIIAGTDNIVLPSQQLYSVDGRKFSELTEGNLFFFSKKVRVKDDDNSSRSDVLSSLEQLGIMIVDPSTSHPIEFLEKVSREEILKTLEKHQTQSVYFNAFVFACSKKASSILYHLYERKMKGGDHSFYEQKDFDWSGHVIEPLALQSSGLSTDEKEIQWKSRWTSKQKKAFAVEDDWMMLLSIAGEFIEQCGSPIVLDLGEDTLWYDTGMCKDLYDLHQLTVSKDKDQRKIIRKLLSVPQKENIVNCSCEGEPLIVETHSFLMNSTFNKGGTIGDHCIIVNSTFDEYVTIPDGCVIINSQFKKLRFHQDVSCCLVYSYQGNDDEMITFNNSVYFSMKCHDGNVKSGIFPLYVVPKHTSSEEYFGHYNKDDNSGVFLSQKILGMDYSFRELQQQKIPTIFRQQSQ